MCLHIKCPWRVLKLFFSVNLCPLSLQLNRQLSGKKAALSEEGWRCEVEHSAIVSLSLSAGPPESFALRGGRGLTQGGQGISSFSAPKGEGIMSENRMNRETREETLYGCKRCIFHHTVFTVALFSAGTANARVWDCICCCVTIMWDD